MLNLLTTISLGCFDALNVEGDTRITETDDGEIRIRHRTENDYVINTMTYCLTTEDEINGMITYLKNNVLKTTHIVIYKENTNTIQKII